MAFSVNTNNNAMAALQSLNKTNKGLDQVSNRVSTGMKVASTKDDSATFITAQSLRGKKSDLTAVTASLSNAKSVVDTAVSGTETISDTVNQMKTIAKQAADTTITGDQRTALSNDFQALVKQITTVVNSSEFNGANVLNSKATVKTVSALQSLTNMSTTGGYTPDTLQVDNLGLDLDATETKSTDALPGKLGKNSALASADDAKFMDITLDAYKTKVTTALGTLGSASRAIDAQLSFTSKLSDTMEAGIGNLVDADMAKESARLTALQTKQQLGIQALSIANSGPQSIGQLFRG